VEYTFSVTILKWRENNPKHRKGMGGFMIKNGFFSDYKIAQLKPIEVGLFLYLLCIASESSSDQFVISARTLPKQFRISNKSLHNHLDQLQSLQLVSCSKLPPKLIKENKEKGSKGGVVNSEQPTPQSSLFSENTTAAALKRASPATALVDISTIEQMQKLFDDSTLRIWSQLYPDPEFLHRVTLKAVNYYNNNPKKKPRTVKGWKQTLGSWYDKDWPKHVRSIPGEKKQEGWAEGAV
jgi:hypothetical protein